MLLYSVLNQSNTLNCCIYESVLFPVYVCVWIGYQMSVCPLLVGRCMETSHNNPAYPSSSLCYLLSLFLSSLLGCNLTDVENTVVYFFLVVLIFCVCICTWTEFVHWAKCDHTYTWCIYTLFVSLSHQYAAEVKAGCDDPAIAGQLAVAACLDHNTLPLSEQHPRFLFSFLHCMGPMYLNMALSVLLKAQFLQVFMGHLHTQ